MRSRPTFARLSSASWEAPLIAVDCQDHEMGAKVVHRDEGTFRTRAAARRRLRQLVAADSDPEFPESHCRYSISESAFGVARDPVWWGCYRKDGSAICRGRVPHWTEEFLGRPPEHCGIRVGAIVAVIPLLSSGRAQIGIVAAQPPAPGHVLIRCYDHSDDNYCVAYPDPEGTTESLRDSVPADEDTMVALEDDEVHPALRARLGRRLLGYFERVRQSVGDARRERDALVARGLVGEEQIDAVIASHARSAAED